MIPSVTLDVAVSDDFGSDAVNSVRDGSAPWCSGDGCCDANDADATNSGFSS